MLRHKHIERICCIVLAATLLLTCGFMGAAANGWITANNSIGYEKRLFDQSRVHTIDIVMDDWDGFIKTATSEEYAACTVVIDGESYKNVAIRGKGNTSLSSVSSFGNNRYSFKVEFDHYQSGHTYHGLDKLSLNNLIYDNTYMKDYFAYTLMGKMGVAAPLCSFVQINVNGEAFGLYLAVEGVEESFLQRNFGKAFGELYKPDSMNFGGGRGNGGGFDMNNFMDEFRQKNASETKNTVQPPVNGQEMMPEMPDVGSMGAPGGFAPSQGMSSTTAPTATPVVTSTPEPSGFEPSQSAGGQAAPGGMPEMNGAGALPEGFDPAQMTGGQAVPSGMPEMGGAGAPGGFAPSQGASSTTAPTATPVVTSTHEPSGFEPSQSVDGQAVPGMGVPGGFDPSQMLQNGQFTMPEMPADMGNMKMPGGFGGFGGMGSSDVKLQYVDDNPESYANIFNSAKTKVSQEDQTRLIAALKKLGAGDISAIDADAVAMYMAVHNFLENGDSYTGTMVHNYYLYEENGVMQMIPWDYNLAFGTFQGGSSATSSVNSPIDTLVTGGSNDRPMANWITANAENTALYHEKYQQFIDEVFTSGWFGEEIDRVYAMLTPYVSNDPTAFCTMDAFDKAVQTLKTFCEKRAQSVQGQLDGSIPSTSNAQQGSSALIDASDIATSDMGSMNQGGGGFGGKGDRGGMQRENFGGDRNAFFENQATEKPQAERVPEQTDDQNASHNTMREFPGGFGGMENNAASENNQEWLLICVGVLLLSVLFALLYKNKR